MAVKGGGSPLCIEQEGTVTWLQVAAWKMALHSRCRPVSHFELPTVLDLDGCTVFLSVDEFIIVLCKELLYTRLLGSCLFLSALIAKRGFLSSSCITIPVHQDVFWFNYPPTIRDAGPAAFQLHDEDVVEYSMPLGIIAGTWTAGKKHRPYCATSKPRAIHRTAF